MVKIDACLNGRAAYAGKAYFFRADRYIRYDWATDRAEAGYPKPLSEWYLPGKMANGLDAALNGEAAYVGRAYFFRGDRYIRYDWDGNKVSQPQPLAAWNLPGEFARGIDAAINGGGAYAGKAYFFRGNQYVRYDWAKDRPDDGYPQALAAWKFPGEFANGIDAALTGEGPFAGKAYFFKGDQYIRYDWAKDQVDNGYPKPIAGYWPGLEVL